MKSIDLNCDLGEREDLAPEVQEQLLACVTSANIACGAHAGSADLMRLTVRQALRRGVAIGAHPGYPDRQNFGRLEMALPLDELESSVEEQIRSLMRIAVEEGAQLRYVKPHGALYNQAARDERLAAAIARRGASPARSVAGGTDRIADAHGVEGCRIPRCGGSVRRPPI